MRLIDADALKERFDKRIKWLRLDMHDQYSLGLYHGAVTDKDLIGEIPTVDAVEVVHGHFENITGGMVMLGDCSECNVRQPVVGTYYCKNCGAKMDGKRLNDASEKVLNKKRLIDANALKERAIRMVTVNSLGNKQHCYFKAVGTGEIDKATTVDAVEVVRCKDCKYYEIHKPIVLENCERNWHLTPMKPDDFCSYGERKSSDD